MEFGETSSNQNLDYSSIFWFENSFVKHDEHASFEICLSGEMSQMLLNPQYMKGPLEKRMKRSLATMSLDGFICVKNGKTIRKENLIVLVIRGYRRLIQKILGIYKSKRPLLQISYTNRAREILNIFADLCMRGEFRTKALPINNSYRRIDEFNGEKTCNKKFLAHFFLDLDIQKSYYYFIQLLFEGASCEDLCNKFNMRCCPDRSHHGCDSKWEELRQFLEYKYLAEYQIPMWSPNNN